MGAGYEVHVLGRLRMSVGGAELRLGGPRQRAVLALLVLGRGRPVMAERVMESVWGDDAFARSRTTLQVYISNLRQELRRASAPAAIESVSGGYVFALDHSSVDLFDAEELVSSARSKSTSGDVVGAVSAYQEAARRMSAPLLADLTQFDCFSAEMARVEHLRNDAAEELVRCLIRTERFADAAAAAEQLLEREPLREGAWHQLALAEYRSGRQAEALRTLTRAREVLGEEVGLDPGPELQDLEAMIFSQAPELGGTARYPRVRWLDPADGIARVLPLDDRDHALVGRSSGADVVLAGDRLASRSHCTLRRSADGWEVWPDPVAVNGTFVNGSRITGMVALQHADRLRAGETVIVYETGAPGPHDPGLDEPTKMRTS